MNNVSLKKIYLSGWLGLVQVRNEGITMPWREGEEHVHLVLRRYLDI